MFAALVLSLFGWLPIILRIPVLAVVAVFVSVLLLKFAMAIVHLILAIVDAIPFL